MTDLWLTNNLKMTEQKGFRIRQGYQITFLVWGNDFVSESYRVIDSAWCMFNYTIVLCPYIGVLPDTDSVLNFD